MKRVYDGKDLVDAHMMAHALEEGGIRTQVRGEFDLHNLEGPTVWIVDDEDYDKAIRAVAEIIETNRIVEEPSKPSDRRRPNFRSGVLVGVVLGFGLAFLLYTLDIPAGIKPENELDSNGDGIVDAWRSEDGDVTSVAYDSNFDGKPDNWTYFKNSRIQRAEWDYNFDGRPDVWAYFNEKGLYERTEDDIDYDGRVDSWRYYRGGRPAEEAFDNDRDGKKDEWARLENGRVVERKWSYLEDGIIDKKAMYKNGRKVEELYDRDRDGKFDESVTFDEFERVVRRKR